MLRDIWEVAGQFGGQLRPLPSRREAVMHCPFCDDKKQHLYLNRDKGTYYCQRCGASGGMIDLYVSLSGVAREEASRVIFGNGPRRKRHPAELLDNEQFKEMGLTRPHWGRLWSRDPAYARRTANWVWHEWLAWERGKDRIARQIYVAMMLSRLGKGESRTNRVTLTGWLANDPKLDHLQSGKLAASFTLKVPQPSARDNVDFIPIRAWDKQAEVASLFLTKGRLVAIDGRISVRAYEKNGERRYFTEVVAHNIEFLDGPPKAVAAAEVQFNEEEVPF